EKRHQRDACRVARGAARRSIEWTTHLRSILWVARRIQFPVERRRDNSITLWFKYMADLQHCWWIARENTTRGNGGLVLEESGQRANLWTSFRATRRATRRAGGWVSR